MAVESRGFPFNGLVDVGLDSATAIVRMRGGITRSKFRYLLWAARRWPGADKTCPACLSASTRTLKRKALVTSLYVCNDCHLMFRVPKNTLRENREFYQHEYQEGFTTDCPNDNELSVLLARSFGGTEKDYSEYISVVRAAGLRPGQVILDYGCSWGYGSWQFSRAGFNVYSYEVSQLRAAYAASKLNVRTLSDPEKIPEKVDCFFSAHVIEHLPNPRMLWEQAANVLKPDGTVVLFMPNGESSRQETEKEYHSLWGLVHPLLLSSSALSMMAKEYGFSGNAYSTPFDLGRIADRVCGRLNGHELLFVARRATPQALK